MEQIFSFVNKLNSAQRAVIIGGFSLLFVFLMGLLIYSNIKAQEEKFNYIIASGLTKNQVMLASNELEASGIPFTIIGSDNSLTLRTNKANINVAKIKLVTSEAITNKHSGWEIFDKSSLGTTNFENKVKYRRALEGELSRTLESLSGILKASVKIGQPKQSVFTQKKALPTASAVLNLRDGVSLTQKQVSGIKNFIASAVPNLKPENIKLINQNGALLEYSEEDIDNTKYISQEKYKTKLEQDFENKIIALTEPFLGTSRVVAKVSVILNFTKQEISQEIFEPEGTIRSQQTTETTANSEEKDTQASGSTGAANNIQNPDEEASASKLRSSKEEAKNVTNYEISKKIVSQRNSAYATIDRITAAVTFDSAVLEKVTNKDEFLQNINAIVEETIGYKKERGDKVTVKSFKFLGLKDLAALEGTGETTEEDGGGEDTSLGAVAIKSMMQDFGEYIQYLIAGILLFIFYKKFIASNEIVVGEGMPTAGGAGGTTSRASGGVAPTSRGGGTRSSALIEEEELDHIDNSFNNSVAKNRLKAKVKGQILNNIEGLDDESAAKYEVLIEELDRQVQDNPEEIANMIEMLLYEGDTKFRTS